MSAPSAGGPGRPVLLLVEDHADSRAMYAEYLTDRFEVIEAGDGQTAWDLVQRRAPDVIVTDLALPGVDGYELIAKIRADARIRDIPIIALSGYSAEAPPAGAPTWDVVLEKPCLPEQVAEAVAAAASSRRNGS